MNIAAILTLNVNEDMLQMWPVYNNTGSKKYNSKMSITSADHMIRSDVWHQTETLIPFRRFNDLRKVKNQLLYLVCYIIWNYMNK